MIGVIYLGNNPQTQERLKYLPGQLVKMTTNYKDAAMLCEKTSGSQHYIIFLEKGNKNEDTVAITYLKKHVQTYTLSFLLVSFLMKIERLIRRVVSMIPSVLWHP